MEVINQLLGGVTQIWLNVAFLVCIFGVLIFRPERIQRPSLFNFGCVLFTLSLIAPSVLMLVLSSLVDTLGPSMGGAMRGRSSESAMLINLLNTAAPLLFAGAFLACIASLSSSQAARGTASAVYKPIS